ncbi:hypothetical protein ACN38_g8489 [Penicillium nordicum]|uniref:Uncharacterized protein n=1 Tax=Penicillium nordicum TaxID=229535 RepID=A0A0M8P582_9EURO|nr:hypothetical protein ACN38_g8489 [Penicillium nordicum]
MLIYGGWVTRQQSAECSGHAHLGSSSGLCNTQGRAQFYSVSKKRLGVSTKTERESHLALHTIIKKAKYDRRG